MEALQSIPTTDTSNEDPETYEPRALQQHPTPPPAVEGKADVGPHHHASGAEPPANTKTRNEWCLGLAGFGV